MVVMSVTHSTHASANTALVLSRSSSPSMWDASAPATVFRIPPNVVTASGSPNRFL